MVEDMHKAVVLTFALLAVACSKKKPDEQSSPTPVSGSSAATAPATGTTVVAAAGGLTCDKVLPQAMRDKYFKGRTVKSVPAVTESNVECKVAADDSGIEPTISATCHDSMAAAKDASIAKLKEMFKEGVTDVTDIGKGGILIDLTMFKQLTVWDDDSSCMVSVNMPSNIDVRAVTKDLIALLPVK